MTLPVPNQATYTVGEILTSSLMNSNVRDAVTFLAQPPVANLYQNIAQSIANGVWVSITFDSETVDSYSGHSNTTNPSRYVAPQPGYYLVRATASFTSNATGRRIARILVNGTTAQAGSQTEGQASSGGNTSIPTSATPYLNTGDYVELQAQQTSGAALSMLTGGSASVMSVFWVHA